MGFAAGSQAAEWRRHWPLVLAATLGYSVNAIPFMTIGLFFEPLSLELGWSRTLITAGASLGSFATIVLAPLLGVVIDRFGVRRMAFPGLVLAGGVIAAFGFVYTPVQWMVVWGVYAVVIVMLNATLWTKAVSSFFAAGRGMALAVVLSGSAFTGAVAPPIARWLIDAYGWRDAYLYLAVGWTLPALILCVFFLYDARDRQRLTAVDANEEAPSDVPGLSVREAIRSWPLIRVGLATLITLLISNTLVIHKIPILTAAGVTRETAAFLVSLSSLAGIVGGLSTGWLVHKFNPGMVGAVTNSVMALALIFLLEPFRTPLTIVLSMAVVGYAGGMKMEICAYLTSVYAGLKNYGKIFGVMASIIAVCGSIAPMFGGVVYDLTGSYTMLIAWSIPVSLVSGLLLVGLGPFPSWSRAYEPSRGKSKPAEVAQTEPLAGTGR